VPPPPSTAAWGSAPVGLPYLALGALQVPGDHGVLGPVQHAAQLLAQLQRCRPHQPRRLPPDPDEDVGPAVQDVHALGVQQALQLGAPQGTRGSGTHQLSQLENSLPAPKRQPGRAEHPPLPAEPPSPRAQLEAEGARNQSRWSDWENLPVPSYQAHLRHQISLQPLLVLHRELVVDLGQLQVAQAQPDLRRGRGRG